MPDKSQEEALFFSMAAFPAVDTRSEQRKKGSKKGHGLEEVIVIQYLTTEEFKEEANLRGVKDAKWIDTGLYDESTEIQIIERNFIKEIHRKHKSKLYPNSNPDPHKESLRVEIHS